MPTCTCNIQKSHRRKHLASCPLSAGIGLTNAKKMLSEMTITWHSLGINRRFQLRYDLRDIYKEVNYGRN